MPNMFIVLWLSVLGSAPAQTAVPPEQRAEAAVVEMLQNIRDNGFNSNPAINNGLGGLWINWRYGSTPLQTNFNGTGSSDGPGVALRHDVLTDLRYLHNLLLYKKRHPQDKQFDADIARFRKIVRPGASSTSRSGSKKAGA